MRYYRFFYALLYLLGYIILSRTVSLPLFVYYVAVVCICKLMSCAFVQKIEAANRHKQIVGSRIYVKPLSDLSLRGGLSTLLIAGLSFVVRNYSDAQCVLVAFAIASVVFPTIADAVKMLYVKDPFWLVIEGEEPVNTDGHLGIPNTISIIRIAVAAALPLLFVWLQSEQGRVACFIALVIIIFSDWIDGHVARLTKSVTKAGKYLDPLGDKVLFIPNSVAFIVIFAMRGVVESHVIILTAIMIFLTISRDILFCIWFALNSKRYPKGVGAGPADKARMFAICCWLIICANIVTVDFWHSAFVIYATIFSILMAILSFASIFHDLMRLGEENDKRTS